MGAAIVAGTGLQQRLQEVPRPQPVLSRERERRLTARQREILDHLSERLDQGFADLTMAGIAASLNCSLRTLYGVAPSRDELVLVVVDRKLWRVGRNAREAIEPGMRPLEALRAYLRGASVAVSRITEDFARDLAEMPAAEQLRRTHGEYLVAVAKCLLDLAVDEGQIADMDTAAVAQVMANVAVSLSQPDVIPTLRSSPKQAADAVVEIFLRGLVSPPATASPERPPNKER